ncbi:MAG: DUF3566 domain-containing protein [Ilumatobacteraceae bacterium]
MSTTEHDLDALGVDALDDDLEEDLDDDLDLDAVTDVDVADADEVDEDVDDPDEAEARDTADETDPDDSVADDPGAVLVDERDVDGVDDAVDVDADARDDTSDRLGHFDAFLTEAQADHADDLDDLDDLDDDDDDEYELPAIIMATELDDDDLDEDLDDEDLRTAMHVDGRTLRPDELEVGDVPLSDDALDELRRADIDGPTVPVLPHDEAPRHRRLKRSPDYDPAPMPIPLNVPRILGRKPRVRRVTRVVRHVDPWSVFKIAIIANILIYVIVLVAGVLLWNVANATGTVDNVERFFESFGWSTFEFNGGEIYHSAWTAGIFLVIGFTGLAVLAATMFNLITDLVGGMRFTVLEEEVVEARTSPMRRFVVRRSEPEIPLVTNDSSGQIIRESVVDDSNGFVR